MRELLQSIGCTVLLCLSQTGCAGFQGRDHFAVSHTLSNYKTGLKITITESYTDRGKELPFQGVLISSTNPYSGVTAGGIGDGIGLPEWMDVTWRESGPDWDLTAEQYRSLGADARRERLKAYRTLPLKSARIAVNNRIPAKVVHELLQSGPDPGRANLPLKSLRLYLVWTKDGVKLRWQVLEKCCTVLYEGGDAIDQGAQQ